MVHRAWANGSSWNGVIRLLQQDGDNITAPQFPLTALADDVARLRQARTPRASLAWSTLRPERSTKANRSAKCLQPTVVTPRSSGSTRTEATPKHVRLPPMCRSATCLEMRSSPPYVVRFSQEIIAVLRTPLPSRHVSSVLTGC